MLFFCINNTHAGRQKNPTKKAKQIYSKPKIINKMDIEFITIKRFVTTETLLIHILGQHDNNLVKHVCRPCFDNKSNKPKSFFPNRHSLCNHINKNHPTNKRKQNYLYCSYCSLIIQAPNKNSKTIQHLQNMHSLPRTPNLQPGSKSKSIAPRICWICHPPFKFNNS